MKKLVLIDSNALVHRAFHALPPLSAPDGRPTNAVFGFTSLLMKMLADVKPDYVAATFDLAGPTFRHKEFEAYKAHRERAPDELYAQIPPVKEMLGAFGIPVFEREGYEADDILGTIARTAGGIPDLQTIIVTGDLDTLQLVDGTRTVVTTLRKGMTDIVTYDEAAVRERYGLTPDQVTDFKGLKGDPSDNIPGVKGIGEKTASTLIQEFGTIERLYEALETGTEASISEKLKEKLLAGKDSAVFSKRLATIACDVPLEFSLQQADWRSHADPAAIETLCNDLGFSSLIKRIPTVLGQERQATFSPEKMPEPAPVPTFIGDVLVGHDLKIRIKQLMEEKEPLPAALFDTMIALWLLNPDARQYEYPGGTLTDVKKDLEEKLAAIGVSRIFEEIEMPLVPILAFMERTGIRVDTNVVKELLIIAERTVGELEEKIWKAGGGQFNINSPSQLGEVLFTRLGIKGRVRRTRGGAPSTAAPELEKLRDEHPIIDLVLQYREMAKLKTTYIEPFPALVGPDGRIHTTYHQTGTATGRLSSSDPNLQNVPTRTELGQRFRAAFIADPGWKLVSLDYSQLELRIVAHIAGDDTMMEAFRAGEDIHARTASEVFGVAPAAVTKDMRRQAKVLNFGIIYGMGSLGFARAAGVGRDQAKRFIEEYFSRFPGIAHYMERTKQEAYERGYVATLLGRRRPLPDITSRIPQLAAAAERMAINHPVQGTEADLVKLAMIVIDRHLREHGLDDRVRMLLQVHDELVLEVRVEDVADTAQSIRALMEKVHPLDVPLIVDAKAGDTWADMELIPRAS